MNDEREMMMAMLVDLARRNGGSLTFNAEKITRPPDVEIMTDWDQGYGSLTFRVRERGA